MRAVRLDHARDTLEPLGLLHEVIAHVVADFVDQLAMRVRHLRQVWRVDDHLTPVGDGRLCLVHRFGGGPQVVIDLRRHGQHSLERARHQDDLELRGQIRGCAPRFHVVAYVHAVKRLTPHHECDTQHRSRHQLSRTMDDPSSWRVLDPNGFDAGDQGPEPVSGIDDVWAGDAGEKVLCAT